MCFSCILSFGTTSLIDYDEARSHIEHFLRRTNGPGWCVRRVPGYTALLEGCVHSVVPVTGAVVAVGLDRRFTVSCAFRRHLWCTYLSFSGTFHTVSLTGYSKDLMKVITNETLVRAGSRANAEINPILISLTSSGVQTWVLCFPRVSSFPMMSSPSIRTSSRTDPTPHTRQTAPGACSRSTCTSPGSQTSPTSTSSTPSRRARRRSPPLRTPKVRMSATRRCTAITQWMGRRCPESTEAICRACSP